MLREGFICMWHGTLAELPDGLVLCDGTNGTPDLRDRFIVGAGAKYGVGSIGGQETVLLTQASMPAHSHTAATDVQSHDHSYLRYYPINQPAEPGTYQSAQNAYTSFDEDNTHEHTFTITLVGDGQAHNNLPAFTGLFFVMATKNLVFLPEGVIVFFNGDPGNLDDKWTLCDGTNGTPDLRDRFVRGVVQDVDLGVTGGENEVTLTESEMPTHDHGGSGSVEDTHNHTIQYTKKTNNPQISPDGSFARVPGTTTTDKISGSAGAHSHADVTSSIVGAGQPHENRPPYYALAYIMKVA